MLERLGGGKQSTALILTGICLLLVFLAQEFLGFNGFFALSMGAFPLKSFLMSRLVGLLVACVALACSHKVAGFASSRSVLVASALTACLGLAVWLLGRYAQDGGALCLAGFVLAVASCFVLFIAVFEAVARLGVSQCKKVMTAAFLTHAVISPIYVLNSTASFVVAAVCLVACAACLAALGMCPDAERLAAGESQVNQGQHPAGARSHKAFKKRFRLLSPAIIGFLTLYAGISYLNPLYIFDKLQSGHFVLFLLVTHLLGVAVYMVCALSDSETWVVLVFRFVGSCTVFAFLLASMLGLTSIVPYVMCATLYSAISYLSVYLVVNMATYSIQTPFCLFCAYTAQTTVTDFLASLLAEVEVTFVGTGAAFSNISLVLYGAVIVSSMWLLTERNVNEFFWSAASNGPAGGFDGAGAQAGEAEEPGGKDPIESAVASVAHAGGLTPREEVVLSLLSKGRSASFIAEELGISNNTVRKHVASIYAKCGVHSKQELLTVVQNAV